MAGSDSFAELMRRLRAGDDAVATEVFNRFACQILDLARKQLRESMRRKIDPEDVLQSVMRSFFIRQREGQFDIQNWDNLWGILLVMTLRKCGQKVRYFQADRRDIRREIHLGPDSVHSDLLGLEARDPTPSEAVILIELLGSLMQSLTPTDRHILTLHLQGYTAAEIAETVGRAMRTVRRVLDRIRHKLERMHDAESDADPGSAETIS
jgi:RNA polymerase sigma-70 factor (ECF subfamily)